MAAFCVEALSDVLTVSVVDLSDKQHWSVHASVASMYGCMSPIWAWCWRTIRAQLLGHSQVALSDIDRRIMLTNVFIVSYCVL